MTRKNSVLWILITAVLLVLILPVQADTSDDQNVKVIYQTTFGSDPHWITNSPSTNYWEPAAGRYHFSIEPSTGGYVYVPVTIDDSSFALDYDLMLIRVDDGATFRLALSSNEMNPEKGPSILNEFTNAKFGKIMWLQVVTPGNKMTEVNSQSGVTAYSGSTVKYELNKTYHVSTSYNKDLNMITTRVSDKQTGQEIWSYYIKTTDDITGIGRLWFGSINDFGPMNIYALGYLDNVRITAPETVTAAPTIAAVTPGTTSAAAVTVATTKKATPKTTVPTPYPTATQSPSSVLVPLVALGILGGCLILVQKKE
nr:hypothetical protein [uncultured Methanoregula sp.]